MFQKEPLRTQDVETIIGQSVKLEGTLQSQGDIEVNGLVMGSIKTPQNIRINQSARVDADIQAQSIVVAGEIHGNIKLTETLELSSTGSIYGDVQAKNVVIASGGILHGKCLMAKDEKKTESVNQAKSAQKPLAA